LVSNIPALLGATVSVLCVTFNMPELLMIGRFITGINCGIYRLYNSHLHTLSLSVGTLLQGLYKYSR